MPKFLTDFLSAYGINVEKLKAFLDTIADKTGIPGEWRDKAGIWLNENTSLTSEKIIAIVAVVYAEWTSPTPGYEKDHGRDG